MKHKTGKRLFSFLITLAMIVGVLPRMSMTAWAASTQTWTSGDCTVTYDATSQTVTVEKTNESSSTGNMADYSYYNKDNNTIPWYEYRENITTVTIESGVTGIGDYAFYDFSKISAIAFPDTVTSIGDDFDIIQLKLVQTA